MAIKKPYKDDLFEAIDPIDQYQVPNTAETIGEEAEINDINAVSPDEITGLIPEEQEPVAYEDKRSYTTLELFASDETAKAAANFAVARGVSPSANWLWTLAGESNIVDRIKVPSGWEWNIGGDDGFGDDIFVSPEGITYSYDELMQLGVESDDEVFLEDVAGITGQATTEQQKLIDIQTGLLELFPDMTAQESYEYYFTSEDEAVQEARTEQFFETLQTAGKSDATINLLKSLFPEISNEDLSAILGEQVSDETISEDWWHSMLYGLKGIVYGETGFFTVIKRNYWNRNNGNQQQVQQIEQGSTSLEDIAQPSLDRNWGVSVPWLYKWADENIKRNEEELEEFLKEHPQWDTSYYDDPDYTDISTWTDPGFYASIIPKSLPTAAALIVGALVTAVTKNPRAGLAAAGAFFHPLNTQDRL